MQATIHGLLLEITEVIHVIRIAINQILTSRYPYCILLLMRGRVIHLMGLLMIGLSGALVYVNNRNSRLKAALEHVSTSSVALTEFTLPSIASDTAAEKSIKIDFPRQRSLLILAARRNCPYCRFVLSGWKSLMDGCSEVDGSLYDSGGSYPLGDLQRAGIDPATVLVNTII
jgi:hypothetical protein